MARHYRPWMGVATLISSLSLVACAQQEESMMEPEPATMEVAELEREQEVSPEAQPETEQLAELERIRREQARDNQDDQLLAEMERRRALEEQMRSAQQAAQVESASVEPPSGGSEVPTTTDSIPETEPDVSESDEPSGGSPIAYADAEGNILLTEERHEQSYSSASTMGSYGYGSGSITGADLGEDLELPETPSPILEAERDAEPVIYEERIAKPEAIYETEGFSLPEYPWPPEQPSSRMRMELGWLVADGEDISLAMLEERLGEALTNAGYYEQSFYSVPGGFALVTRLEGIDSNGNPLSEELRYVMPSDDRPFSLTDFVSDLFFAPEGYYRFVTFVVSDQPFVTSTEILPEMAAISRLQSGATDLPASFADIAVTDNLNVDALIYEYRKEARQPSPELLLPGRLPPNAHMANSGIAAAISNLQSLQNSMQ